MDVTYIGASPNFHECTLISYFFKIILKIFNFVRKSSLVMKLGFLEDINIIN